MSKTNIKYLAYYLPQFHSIPENDKWWGKGFTEWTNVKKAKPLFKNHQQPVTPGELGYYNLILQPEIQLKQAELANRFGIDGFIYYQYWFDTHKMLLEKPAENMLANKNINIPFCFCWANETWKGIWHGLNNSKVLIEQIYRGEKGYIEYFKYLLPFFKDKRYIKVNNKPMFHVYRTDDIPDIKTFTNTFNRLALKEGFDGIYFIATIVSQPKNIINNKNFYGIVGIDSFRKMRYQKPLIFKKGSVFWKLGYKIKTKLSSSRNIINRKKPLIFDYKKGVLTFNVKFPHKKYIPCVFPNWDNSPRAGKKSLIFKNSNPKAWKLHLELAVKELAKNTDNPQIVIIKSWNEWAEGNYLEPDKKYGLNWLATVKEVKEQFNN